MICLGEEILKMIIRQGEKIAFIYYQQEKEQRLTYQAFYLLIGAFYQVIQAQALPQSSLIFLMGENSPQWPAAYLAAYFSGHSVIHGDVAFTKEQLTTILDFTKPGLIFGERKRADDFQGQGKVIFLEDIAPLPSLSEPIIKITPLADQQPMSIIFTSGTTASPKGVMLSEANFLSNLRILNQKGPKGRLISGKDRVVAILPFHHVYPFTCTVLAPLYFGATLIYPASLRGEDVFKAVRQFRGTILVAVPKVLDLFCHRVFDTMAHQPGWKRLLFTTLLRFSQLLQAVGLGLFAKIFFHSIHAHFPALRYFACGGARLEADIHRRLSHLGFTIIEAYGLTETSPIAAINDPCHPLPGSVGKPAPGVKITIEKTQADLREGEICIEGPNVMMGYFKRPDLTSRVIREGKFYSGDLGYLDEKGHLFITGRKDEMIVLANGKNVYPEELEKYYQQSEKIAELCITLLKIEGKEFLTAVVYPNKEYFQRHKVVNIYREIRYDLETIAQKLPAYQRVSRIELIDRELPRTSLGKIKRYQVGHLLSVGRPGACRKENHRCKVEEASSRLNKRQDGASTLFSDSRPEPRPAEETQPGQGETDPFLSLVQELLHLSSLPELDYNLETDLGLDSLSKLELFSTLEQRYHFRLSDEQAGGLFTLGEVKKLIPENSSYQPSDEEKNLEVQITSPPEPPLHQHVSTRNTPLGLALRFCLHWFLKVIFKLVFQAKVEGIEYLEDLNPPFILSPNHASYLDGLIIYGLLPFSIVNKCYFLSIPIFFGHPPLSWLQRIGRVILTGTQDTSLRSLQYCYQVTKAGGILCVFPEGARSVDGSIDQPKRGIGYVAKEGRAPLIPIYISGSLELLSRKNPGLHPTSIAVTLFSPIYPQTKVGDFLSLWQKTLQQYYHSLKRA